MRDLLNDILKQHAGLTDKEIRQYTDRNFYMTAEQAKELGIIDAVLVGTQEEEEEPSS